MNMDVIFSKTHLMPTVPKLVQELIESFNQDDIDINSIAKKIAMDQVLSAKVLRLANSSYYGAQRQVGSVDDAVVMLGFNSLRTLVVASGVTGAFASTPGFDRQKFWKSSLVVANLSRAFAKKVRQNPETAFTVGLMHDIGQLLIHIALPQESSSIDKTVAAGAHRIMVEQNTLGFDHSDVGAELARRWNFPASMADTIQYHHAPDKSPTPSVLTYLLATANLLGHFEHGDATILELVDSIPDNWLEGLKLSREALVELLPDEATLVAGLEALTS